MSYLSVKNLTPTTEIAMDLLLLEEAMLKADWLAALICAISRCFYFFSHGQ
jgi:hypothetical protein